MPCRKHWGWVALVCLSLISTRVSFSQSQNAVLGGVVSDQSGAPIAQAAVTATSIDRQDNEIVQTDSQGRFSFPNLRPGNYDITFEAKGFNTYEQRGLLLLVNQTVTLPITLTVGDTSTRVEVTAEAAQLNQDNGTQQEGVPPATINQLPLLVSGGTPRNVTSFVSFLPGVNTGTSQQAFNARINGGLKMGDEAIMDGVSMQEGTMSQSGMVAFNDFPTTPDMVSEVRVLTSSYAPEYGVTTGGVIIVTTKSGTDQFHAGAFEYLRNKDLNALQFTDNRPGGDARPQDTENEWGGYVGGPVKLPFLPFVWGSTHKTYFFFDAEYLRATGGTNRPLYSIPSLQERQGDFSDMGSALIYDPNTGNGNPANRTAYAGNMIPLSEQSKLAQQWMQYLPQPTSSGPYNNYLGTPVPNGILGSTDLFLYKIDHNWGEKDHIYVTIWRQRNPPNNQCALPVMLCTSSPANPEDAWVNRLNWDHIFTPSLLSHFAVGYLNRNEGYGSVPGQDPSKLPEIPNAVAYNASPSASFSGPYANNYSSWGNTDGLGALNKTTRPTYVANEMITWVHGAHTVKFGGEYRHIQQVFRENGNQSGSLGFSAASTGLPGEGGGNPYASLYIGAVGSGSLTAYNVAKYGAEQRAYSLHVGDTWKLNPKLTINYGLRWDLFTPTWESNNQLAFFSFADNPDAGNLPGSLAFAGSNWGAASAGVRYPENLFKGGFAPRFGLAYSFDQKTVVRGGYGMFYTQAFYPSWGGGMSLDGFNPAISFGSTANGYQPAFSLDSGFPAYSTAEDISAGADNGRSGPTYRPAYANHLSYTQQWNLTVERKIGGSAIASIGYVGSRGTHLPSQLQPLNYLNPSLLSTFTNAQLITAFQPGQTSLLGVNAPYAGWAQQLTSVGTCPPTVAQAMMPFPQYCGGLVGLNENEGISFYNSLQTKIEKQFAGGLYVGANYTYSRLMTNASSTTQANSNYGGIGAVINPLQGNRNYTLSTDDVPNNFALMAVYDLPVGKGKRWLGNSNFLDYLVGGWRLASSLKLTSGTPLYFRNSNICNVPGQFQAACIPGITDPSSVMLQSYGNLNVNKPLYNAAAFQPASLFAQGNYLGTGPRVSDIRSSPYRDTNISLSKTFGFKEHINVEVRAEVFNVFNNHYFTCDGQAFGDCIPFNNDPSSSSFGVWSGTVSQPRNVQLVGRITF